MEPQPPTTLFTWGYYGWGNATPQLVAAVDAVEQSRGFVPPLFVDTRIRRTVRAKGFVGNAFGELLGKERHEWMKKLGNKHIETRTGDFIQIAEPAAAADLLARAADAAVRRQRVLFFCGCQYPREHGVTACHRDAIATLVLEAARVRGQTVEVIEWPGGAPTAISLKTTLAHLKAVRNGRTTVPLSEALPVPTWLSLPWGSAVRLRAENRELVFLSGPAVFQRGQWALPVFQLMPDADDTDWRQAAAQLRHGWGLETRTAG